MAEEIDEAVETRIAVTNRGALSVNEHSARLVGAQGD
jgi:hypothetical protein